MLYPLQDRFDKWLFVLKYLANLQEQPEPLREAVFSELFEVAEIANFTPVEQQGYQNSLKYYRHWNSVASTLKQEGKEEGLEEGKRNTQWQIARELLGLLGDDAIAQATELSIQEIQVLRAEMYP